MTAASLIGFGLVFLLVCAASSALLAALLPALGRGGPAVTRRLAELAAVVPVALAAAIVAILMVASVVGVDHCDAHGHHAHLCLRHGGAWAARPWAVAAVAAGLAVVAVRAGGLLVGLARARRGVAALREVVPGDDARVRVVPSARAFCFVAGVRRPAIFASTAARAALAPDEWDAMLAHEHSHVTHGDLRRRLGLELLLLWAAPLAGEAIRARWDAATEQLRDADAAERAGADAVARALVRMARAQAAPRLAGVAAFTATDAGVLATRVAALLEGAPRGEARSRALARRVVAVAAAGVALGLGFAGALHHALETLLG